MNADVINVSPNSVAAYLRMSTEHQQYSTANQMEVILDYTKRRGLSIVKVYSDEGKSGLNIHGRNALIQMIQDVQSGQANFSCILVYDVSRWGRFQDADESAHYEYICRQAGISVHYCAEQFVNDGSPISTIVKGVKRAMAGEYSRELSSKVFQGACRLVRLGYRQGGKPGFGLRRMLVDQTGKRKTVLNKGEEKSIQTDRVILVPGPVHEVEIVRRIYEMFLNGKAESEIVSFLNAAGILTDCQRPWTKDTVRRVLTDERYIGNNLYYQKDFKLQQKHVSVPREKWIRAEGVFEKIIPEDQFKQVQSIISARRRRFTDNEILDKLRGLVARHRQISLVHIEEAKDLPSRTTFRSRFGSLLGAYRLIGYDPRRDYTYVEIKRRLRNERRKIILSVLDRIEELGAQAFWERKLSCSTSTMNYALPLLCAGIHDLKTIGRLGGWSI